MRRIPGAAYIGQQRYLLTICTYQKRRTFESRTVVGIVIEQILRVACDLDFAVVAYCNSGDARPEGRAYFCASTSSIAALKALYGCAPSTNLATLIGPPPGVVRPMRKAGVPLMPSF